MAQKTEAQQIEQMFRQTPQTLTMAFASAAYSDEEKVELAKGVNQLILGLGLQKGPQ